MGGTFIHLDLDTDCGTPPRAAAATPGSWARTGRRRQRALLAPHVAAADVLITTAAIPGRAAPLLVTTDMVAGMRAGSVVVDLAAESGGNVEGVIAGRDLQVPVDGGSVTLVGLQDAASAMPSDASRLFAKNVANLLALMTADGKVVPDFDDEVVAGACLTHGGSRPACRHRRSTGGPQMMDPITLLTVVVLAVFVGFEVVSKVTSKLHTPLMSGANAIHGIILVGAIIVAGQASDPWLLTIALIAVVLATANLVGGFVVTDRMLEMFGGRKPAGPVPVQGRTAHERPRPRMDRPALPGGRGLLHPRAEGPELAPDRPARQRHRSGRRPRWPW